MKGHIAFCPHFHQPHFQLYKTREEAYDNSYRPWLNLLNEAVKLDKFFINLHFSGPFLYWMRDTREDYIQSLKALVNSNKVGIIGGLADEPFIQLSSRSDDYLYQLKMYDELCGQITGVSAKDWQGIHLVERECSEAVLYELSKAAELIKAPAVYYLDAETFYQSHFSLPGGSADYCLQHFGFKDPYSKTTISHIPQEMLYYALRDEISGQAFYALPIHSQYRYQLLKRNSFTADDNIRIKAKHYLFYIKDALQAAAKLSRKYGRELEPILLIFEDAEKFGQWSKDPAGDTEWLMEFFQLVDQDEELEFTGIKDYINKQGFLDTYPSSNSHSYPEWENWTAHRGIRGTCFGDERLRRIISRLRYTEEKQDKFEKEILKAALEKKLNSTSDLLSGMLQRAVVQSNERHDIILNLLEENYPDQYKEVYKVLNRTRNMLYQEDPKWASRHPGYGSSPYYDMQGLSYLEIADRVLEHINIEMQSQPYSSLSVRDWDVDGSEEVVVQNVSQTVCIDLEGGCVSYHHVISPKFADDPPQMLKLLQSDIGKVKAYNSVYRYSYPLVLTETDSSLQFNIYKEGARKEVCRNAYRCDLIMNSAGKCRSLGDLARAKFILEKTDTNGGVSRVVLSCNSSIDIGEPEPLKIQVTKEFIIDKQDITVLIKAKLDRKAKAGTLFLAPQIVTSATPSDEITFKPCSFIGFQSSDGPIEMNIKDVSVLTESKIEFQERSIAVAELNQVDYVYYISSANGDTFKNQVTYSLNTPTGIAYGEVKPAVVNYYQDLVFEEQSRLGYHSSGLMIIPYVTFTELDAEIDIKMTWDLDSQVNEDDYIQILRLIEI